MTMRQSKYVKRKPATTRSNKVPAVLPGYALGIFIDDVRELTDVSLPKAEKWIVIRSYRELSNYLKNIATQEHTAFISFDHYLDKSPDGNRFNGNDCCDLCYLFRSQIACHVDIQGHSADPSCNDYKMKRWYGNTSHVTKL
jgi:hypothetical protein